MTKQLLKIGIKKTVLNINQIILNNPVLYNIMKRISHKKGDNHSENI